MTSLIIFSWSGIIVDFKVVVFLSEVQFILMKSALVYKNFHELKGQRVWVTELNM